MPPSTPPSSRGYRILCSMLYSITNTQEIAATMAALLLRRQSPFWFSHDVIFVNPSNLLNGESVMEDVAVFPEAFLTGKKTKVKDRSFLLRQYRARQPELADVWFAEVCENYIPETPSAVGTNGDSTVFVQRDSRKVLVVAGKPIPDITSQLDSAASEFYYQTLFLLFYPHRQSTFTSRLCDPRIFYQQFINSGPREAVDACRRFEEHWQDFHRGQHEYSNRDETPEQELIRARSNGSVDEIFTQAFGVESDSCVSEDECDCSDVGGLPTAGFDYSIDSSLASAEEVITGALNLPDIVEDMSRQYSHRDFLRVPTVPEHLSIDDYLVQVAGDDVSDDLYIFHGTSNFLKAIPTVRTRIEAFTECFQPVLWQPPENAEFNIVLHLQHFSTIAETSSAFRLNFWQHAVFEMAARHLLWSYMKDIEDESQTSLNDDSRQPYDLKDQFIGYLGGEAGTGKSTVIHALLTFAEKWGRSGTVETTAFTGVAAANINGKTLHNSRNLKVIGYGQRNAPTLNMKQQFQKVVLVIIDEVSMTDRALLGSTDLASQDMASHHGQLMGGKHILLCGDWLQLPPVQGTPCYVRPTETANQYHHAGYNLYRAVNFVVFLTENMRSQKDPVYAEILAALRWGRLTSQHMELLNSRVLQYPRPSLDVTISLDFYRPVVVSTNKLRCAINRLMALKTTSDITQPLYEIQATSSSRSQRIFKRILNANDDLTEGISMRLYLSMGMPVMITRKHPALSKFKIITNGTLATVVGFSPPLVDLDTEIIETTHGTVHRLLQTPKLIFLRIYGCEKVLVSGLATGVIGIPSLTEQVKLSKFPNLSQASITVKQFPVVPAFACTTEKLQGKTCHLGVSVSRLSRLGGVPTQTFYVALSRTTTLANLTLTEPLTAEYLSRFHPDHAAAAEMMRLMGLVQEPPYTPPQEKERFEQWLQHQKVGHN